jgi:hypothetical protein
MGNCIALRETYKSSITINSLWYYLTNNNARKQVYFINSRNIERYEIKRVDNQFVIVDLFNDIKYNLTITHLTLTDCVLTGKYTDNGTSHKRSFKFKLLDNFATNKNVFGWRTPVTIMERNKTVDVMGLF